MIDEKKLIEEIQGRQKYYESKAAEYDEAGERYEYLMDVCNGKATELTATLSIINEQPKVGEWIPCSERLPEDFETVTVTWVNREPMRYYEVIKDKPFVDAAMRFKGKWYWWSATLKDYLLEYGEWEIDSVDDAIEITAWQPLPEPWEGEE